ncbi:formimidoylglutamate deiminase [soil metagenome]
MTVLAPELIYRNGAFHAGLAIEYDAGFGRILRIAARDEFTEVVPLAGRALLPGFVNAHSHAFQRLIRGRTQWRPTDGIGSDFWSWREAMYHAALSLSPDDVYAVSRFCFLEMLRAGITAVGEFHYLHNDPAGRPYDDRAELAHRVIAAARDVGMRIRLLNVCYATGAIGAPLRPEQRRFGTPVLDEFLRSTASLVDAYAADPLVSIGVAPHSIRAVPSDWLRPLHEFAVQHDLPFHMHVSEQPAEVDACVAAWGVRPVELLHDRGVLDARFTGVHATHISDAEITLLARSDATVCACPGTERDLGDGFLRAVDLASAGVCIALGTDSQTIIDMLEEMRLVEYHERLRRLERVVVTGRPAGATPRPRSSGQIGNRLEREALLGPTGRQLHPAPLLLEMGTVAGARSLHVESGVLDPGALADFVTVNLDDPTLAGWTRDSLAAMLALSAPSAVISDAVVAGRRTLQQRTHVGEDDVMHAFTIVARRLAEGA